MSDLPPQQETKLKILSFNCWGLKYVAKNRSERIEAIATTLRRMDHDIVALQELWVYSDYELVKENVAIRLPYAKFYYSGALGAGLVIFSRFPIVETSIQPYSLNGEPTDVGGGDWFVGKAAASAVILHPVLGEVQVFNTHLYAKGGEEGPEHNRAHRLVNAWEFSKLARHAAELGRYVIAAGDFNSIPTTLPMAIVRDHASLYDSWSITHPNTTRSTTVATDAPPEVKAIELYGVTADSPANSYTADKPLDNHARKFSGKRLDYILYRQPSRPYASSELIETFPVLKPVHTKVVLTEKVPGYDFSYSDHFGLEATFEFPLFGAQVSQSRFAPTTSTSAVSSAASSLATPSPTGLSDGNITTTISALTACYQFSRDRSSKELTIFGLSLTLLLGITVGSTWLPYQWMNPLFILISIFFSWLATTMLYEGFVFGNWESRALQNVIEEMEVYRKGLVHKSEAEWSTDS